MSISNKLAHITRRFKNETAGNISIMFVVSIFTILIAVGGAIDISRTQQDKLRAQSLADASALQAVIDFKDSDSVRSARNQANRLGTLYESSKEKSDRWSVKTTVIRDKGEVYEFVTTVTGSTQTTILSIIGMDEIPWSVEAHTRYEPQKTELVLVLDVSQSMKYSEKMTLMKEAAVSFIEELGPHKATDSYFSVSLIPYGEHINFGQDAKDWLAFSETPTPEYSSEFHGCFRHYDNRTIGSLQAVETDTAKDKETKELIPYCGEDSSKALLHSTSSEDLVEHIEGMDLVFGTGTDKALDWGRRLFHPSWRSLMRYSTTSPEAITADTKKYIIILTDGKIVHGDSDQNGVKDGASGGLTDNYIPIVDPTDEFIRICDEIEAEGDINVYSIAYALSGTLTSELENALSGCATGTGQYFKTGTEDLSAVFNEIRSDIVAIAITK